MMGIMVKNHVFTYEDNQSVLWNTMAPDSTLKMISIAIAYNFVGDGVARKGWITGYFKTSKNYSNLLTK